MRADRQRRRPGYLANWLGVIYRADGRRVGDPEWDSRTGFNSRQLRLAMGLPASTVSFLVLAVCLFAAAVIWGGAGFVYALALAGAALPLIVGLLSIRSGAVLIREAYGSAGIIVLGVLLLVFGLALLAAGVYVAAFPWFDDRLLQAFQA